MGKLINGLFSVSKRQPPDESNRDKNLQDEGQHQQDSQ
jgi:hypothetical protein